MADDRKDPAKVNESVPPASADGSNTQPKLIPKLIKVTLKSDHRHADVAYKAGDEIQVNEVDANWLRANKVI